MIQNVCKPAAVPLEIKGAAAAFPLGMRTLRSADFLGNSEPSLDEVLSDEVIRRVMARDGVGTDELLSLVEEVRARLR